MTRWTSQQVLALAPDPASAKAGRALATPRPWSGLGQDERAVWGLCQGSGKKPYQTQVELPEPAFKCSCPSRKFPCKHALALLLLFAEDAVPDGQRPEWVQEWLDANRDCEHPQQVGDDEAPVRKRARDLAERVPLPLTEA